VKTNYISKISHYQLMGWSRGAQPNATSEEHFACSTTNVRQLMRTPLANLSFSAKFLSFTS